MLPTKHSKQELGKMADWEDLELSLSYVYNQISSTSNLINQRVI